MKTHYPRLVVAGTRGDSGKTIVSLGLLRALRKRGLSTIAFKKGPDFIDAAWLGWAAEGTGRNLDTYIMGADGVRRSFYHHAHPDRISLIEGNRGVHDGSDAQGTHSTAELAKLLQAPLVLVLPITKTTRTAAAWVLGCQQMDPEMNLAGVILNQCAGPRHKRVTTEAIESLVGVPVLGAIPKLGEEPIPNRHLGLVPLYEHNRVEGVDRNLTKIVEDHVDVEKLIEIARSAPEPNVDPVATPDPERLGQGLTVGVIIDPAFSFYYAENLEALEDTGARIVKISALENERLPEGLDALYIGGGFPETHLERLVANRRLMEQVKTAAQNHLPIYAECGGLMYLAQSVQYAGATYPQCGVLPLHLKVSKKPQGHGYCEMEADRPNPFFPEGTVLRGHEFHYSAIVDGHQNVTTALAVRRGTGCFDKRDGIVYKNVFACYLHLHAAGAPEWTRGMIHRARAFRQQADRAPSEQADPSDPFTRDKQSTEKGV